MLTFDLVLDAFGRERFFLVRHVPEWLPWFSYKPIARYGYNLGQEVTYGQVSLVKESIVRYVSVI